MGIKSMDEGHAIIASMGSSKILKRKVVANLVKVPAHHESDDLHERIVPQDNDAKIQESFISIVAFSKVE